MEVVSTLKELLTLHPLYNEHLRTFANVGGDLNNPDRLADMAASITSAEQADLQDILEELNVVTRWGASSCPYLVFSDALLALTAFHAA